jgi:hypothetical protein
MVKLFSWFKRKKSDEALPATQPAEPTPVMPEPTKAAVATQAPSMSSDAVVRKSTKKTGGRSESGAGAKKPAAKKTASKKK